MQGCNLQALVSSSRVVKFPFLAFLEGSPPCSSSSSITTATTTTTTTTTKGGLPSPPRISFSLRYRDKKRINAIGGSFRAQSFNADIGTGGYVGDEENDSRKFFSNGSVSEDLSELKKPPRRVLFPAALAGLLLASTLAVCLIAFVKGGHTTFLDAIAKSGFTAAFTLIFVSEIGDKTFFIAALLAMQYAKGLVLLGSMGALSLMTILSVVIGRIFHSVPAQFHTTLPIGEYAAVALLMFFGFNSIKTAWDIQPDVKNKNGPELGEYVEAEELVKEKVSKKLTNPLEIIWKSFSLVFFAEWGDRSMLATIALGAAQSPWGVASGAIVGHLIATSVAILGGAFLANYISEKMAGYFGGALFLIFAIATLVGVF